MKPVKMLLKNGRGEKKMLCLYLIYKRNRNNNIKEKIIAEQFCTIIRFGFSSSKKAKTFFFVINYSYCTPRDVNRQKGYNNV